MVPKAVDRIAGTRQVLNAILICVVAGVLLASASACGPSSRPESSPQPLTIPSEAELSRQPAIAQAWADRLRSSDASVSAVASRTLVEGGVRSIPLLRQLLRTRDEVVRARTADVIAELGPDALGLLTEMLADRRIAIRRVAIDLLIDLAPETESMQPTICRALKDEDAMVARDAARALGALGERASASTPALIGALSHADRHVRIYAAEALASVGPAAVPATPRLIALLGDPSPGVRWATCEALAGIGPAAVDAVPRLIDALKDDTLYVRICAAGALGSIGPKASAAVDPLSVAAADDANLQAEARWALSRIRGEHAPASPLASASIPGPSTRHTSPIPHVGDPPADWDVGTGRNVIWSAELGGDSMGRPVVSGNVVYVGTDNARKRDPAFPDPCGVLMAFRASDGEFIWQDLAPRVANRGTGQFMLPSTTSASYVDGDRLYYVTAECQLRCLDARTGQAIWELDMCAKLGVFPHEAANSDVLPIGGDLLVVCTSNGVNEGHTRVPSPRAPSLIAVDKRTGDVVWRAAAGGESILHGEWCSPVAISVPDGPPQVLFGGGDGWLRAYDAETGREIWRFDGNPKDAKRRPRPGVLSRNPIVASPVSDEAGRVFIAMGDDPSHGDGPSLVHAIRPNGHGDVTDSRRVWTSREVGRAVGTPVVKDGLLYLGDLGGTVTCLDAATGALVWRHETEAAIWGCLMLAGGKLYAGNVDGVMTVLRAGRTTDVLARIEMGASLYARPAVVGDAIFLATARRLYLISAKP